MLTLADGHVGPLVTVIVRTKNSRDTIAQALNGLFSQTFQDFELLVVDSGSTDGTLDVVSSYPCEILRIEAHEYYPGPVLNRAIARSATPVVVLQNSDVVPLGVHALERLLEPLRSGRAQASFARQRPRPEAHTWVRADYERAFPAQGPAPAWLPYSLPLAAMLKSSWLDQPFYDDAWGSEDTEWGTRARERGIRIEYVPEAEVMHSHNYTLAQLYGRRFIEGEADAFIVPRPHSALATLGRLAGSLKSDLEAHLKAGDLRGILASPGRRAVYHWAYHKGRRLGERRARTGDRDASTGQKVVLDRYEA